jgi:F-type H+-transporting ATPase subunit c
MNAGIIAIAAALAALTGFGSAIGMGMAASKAAEAVSRQPEASGKINSMLILSLVIIESTAIYGFVTALMLIGQIGAALPK